MPSFVGNICTKNYRNLIIGFQVTVENVGMLFWDTCMYKTVYAVTKFVSSRNKVAITCNAKHFLAKYLLRPISNTPFYR